MTKISYTPVKMNPDVATPKLSCRPVVTYASNTQNSIALAEQVIPATIVKVSTEKLKKTLGIVLCITYRLPDDDISTVRRQFCDRMNVWHGSEYACAANLELLDRLFEATRYAMPDLTVPNAELFQVLVGMSFSILIQSSTPKDGEPMFYVEQWSAMGDDDTHRDTGANFGGTSTCSGFDSACLNMSTQPQMAPAPPETIACVPPEVISYGRDMDEFCTKLGRMFHRKLQSAGVQKVPVYVFAEADDQTGLVQQPGVDFYDEAPSHNGTLNLCVIGYDIETVETDGETRIISHQFYVTTGTQRVGFILIMGRRFSEANLLKIIELAVPEVFTRVYVSAHYSLIEAGWLVPTPTKKLVKSGKNAPKPLAEGEELPSYTACRIPVRDKRWVDRVFIERSLPKLMKTMSPTVRRSVQKAMKDKKTTLNLTVYFADTVAFERSLASVGKAIGVVKLSHDYISRMDVYLERHPLEFCAYAIRDSIVTAEALPFYGELFRKVDPELLKNGIKLSVPGYSDKYFQGVFAQVYEDLVTSTEFAHWRNGLGSYKDSDGAWQMVPAMNSFLPLYFGGRNEVFEVGARGACNYFDLTSAYPVAVMMLENDHRFDRMFASCGERAMQRVAELLALGPFNLAGVVLSWKFKPDAQPMFPVRVKEGLVFPMIGCGHVMWPELYVALKMDLLETWSVERVIEFRRMETTVLADNIECLLVKRHANKMLFKLLLNSLYGKFAQSITPKLRDEPVKRKPGTRPTPPSALTCYPMAAYATSVCRACMGELLNLNRCYAITTDGFISPESELKLGELCNSIEKRLAPLDYHCVGSDFDAVKSLFVKTRGYVLVGEGGTAKMAKMGVQVDRPEADDLLDDPDEELSLYTDDTPADPKVMAAADVAEFLRTLNTGVFVKRAWPSLPQLRERQMDKRKRHESMALVPTRSKSESRLNTTFDFKRVPDATTFCTSEFEYDGVTFVSVDFKTRPLGTVADFDSLRRLSVRNSSLDDLEILADAAAELGIDTGSDVVIT